jgi:hypothetical protein
MHVGSGLWVVGWMTGSVTAAWVRCVRFVRPVHKVWNIACFGLFWAGSTQGSLRAWSRQLPSVTAPSAGRKSSTVEPAGATQGPMPFLLPARDMAEALAASTLNMFPWDATRYHQAFRNYRNNALALNAAQKVQPSFLLEASMSFTDISVSQKKATA